VSRRFQPLVLCYHAVSEGWDHLLSVGPAALERQVRNVLARRYRPATAEDVIFGSGRLVHVTFDDAFQSVLNALPALERLQVPMTVFACPAYADSGSPLSVPELTDEAEKHPDELATMSWEVMQNLASRGVEVGSHTTTHAHLIASTDYELVRELRESREHLEAKLNQKCRFLSYPYGEHDERVRSAARAAGYEAAFALPGRDRPIDRFALPRVGIWRKDGLLRATLKTSFTRRAIASIREWS
jgi:peptidoglycan/xylan/chitin deacetylase (PgdA/CDA1 family)